MNDSDARSSSIKPLLIVVLLAVGITVAALWTRTDWLSSDSEDPDRQARIDRMAQYMVTVDAYLTNWDQKTTAQQAAADQAVRPTIQRMCDLAPFMPKADIETRAAFVMQLYLCWDPLTHEDP